MQETLEILIFSTLANVQIVHLFPDCYYCRWDFFLQLGFEEYMFWSVSETEYEGNFHVYFGIDCVI